MLTRYNRAIPSLCNKYGHSEIVKLSTFKARYTLRKECASTGKSINCFGPSFSWCTCTLHTFVFNLELCSLRSTACKQLNSFISTLSIPTLSTPTDIIDILFQVCRNVLHHCFKEYVDANMVPWLLASFASTIIRLK